ncbi:MAG: serine/threonine protein kinase, partial [Byssovorax sp.]
LIRARLGEVESQMAAAGKIGQGPGHYAHGRGHLTLQEPEAALDHLKKSEAAGYTSFGLDYALGISLSELYKLALQKTKRIENAEQRKARVAAIEAEYKAPMLQHLRAALGGSIEAPAYVEGLIAFYEGRHDEARALAQKAFALAPWLYEAKKLEGDVLFAVGSRYRADAAFDHDQMMIWFRQAEDAYRIASDLGRSDPAVHEADCDLWTQRMHAASQHDESMHPSFEAARAACERAIVASSKSASGQLKLAQAHNTFAWWVATGDHPEEDPERAIDEAVKRAEAAAQRSPEDPMAPYSVGAVWRTRAIFASNRGLDEGPAVERGIAGYKEALRLEPAFPWALNELCALLSMRAKWEDLHGEDPEASLKEAVVQCDRAIALDADFLSPKMGLIVAYITRAEYLLSTGRSPEPAVTPAIAAIESVKKQNPTWIWIPFWLSHLRALEAAHAVEAGEDPTFALDRAEEGAKELERVAPSSSLARLTRGEVSLVEARRRGALEEDPTPALRQAREAFRRAVEAKPLDIEQRLWSAATEITAIRWAMKQDSAGEAHFDAALAPLLPLLGAPRAIPGLYQTLAEIHELRARWLLSRTKRAEEEITKGLERVEEALALDPLLASALAGKGRLLLLRAKQEEKLRGHGEDALQALAALTAAVRENPLLKRTERRALEEARQLTGTSASPEVP